LPPNFPPMMRRQITTSILIGALSRLIASWPGTAVTTMCGSIVAKKKRTFRSAFAFRQSPRITPWLS
jgi:hypothetical protein